MSKTIATAAPKPTYSEPATVTRLVSIPQASVSEEHGGHLRRHFVVRLPRDTVLDDIRDRRVWRLVQAGRKAFRLFDSLFIIAFDESWICEALVIEADGTGATIHPSRVVSCPEKPALMMTEHYAVTWEGDGYAVRRKADNVRMTEPVANQELAIRDLKNLYSKPA